MIAYITAKVGCHDQLREALLDLVAQTRKGRGCVNYDLHQSQENTSEFVIYENSDKAADLMHTLSQLTCRHSPKVPPTC
jgi:quinol monooxygenase YgiN